MARSQRSGGAGEARLTLQGRGGQLGGDRLGLRTRVGDTSGLPSRTRTTLHNMIVCTMCSAIRGRCFADDGLVQIRAHRSRDVQGDHRGVLADFWQASSCGNHRHCVVGFRRPDTASSCCGCGSRARRIGARRASRNMVTRRRHDRHRAIAQATRGGRLLDGVHDHGRHGRLNGRSKARVRMSRSLTLGREGRAFAAMQTAWLPARAIR